MGKRKLKLTKPEGKNRKTVSMSPVNDEFCHQLLQQLEDAIYLLDPKTKKVLGSNKAFQTLLGYTEEEVLTLSLYNVVAHEKKYIDYFWKLIVEQGEAMIGERKWRSKSGSLVDVHVSAKLIHQTDRDVICAIGRDISDLKKAQEIIIESQRHLDVISKSVPVVLYHAVAGSKYDSHWMSHNSLEITGFSADCFIKEKAFWRNRIHPDDRENVLNHFKSVSETRPIHIEYRWLCADSKYKWFLDQGILISDGNANKNLIYGAWTDITERKKSEELIQQREQYFRRLIENSSVMVLIVDEYGVAKYASPSVEKIFGFKVEELCGRNLFELVHPDDVSNTRAKLEIVLSSPGLLVQLDIRAKHKEGNWLWLNMRGVNLLNDADISGIVLNITDITIRKWAASQLHEAHINLKSTVDAIPDMLFRFDKHGMFIDCHAPKPELLYIQPIDFMWRKASEVLPPDLAHLIYRAIDTVGKINDVFIFEYQMLIKGETNYFEARANNCGNEETIIIVRDITESKILHKQIQTSEKKYREIFENTPIGIFYSDSDGKLLDANSALVKMLGYNSTEELRGQSNHVEKIPSVSENKKMFLSALQEKKKLSNYIVDVFKKDGSKILATVDAHFLHDTSNNSFYILGSIIDVTEKAKAEGERERLITEIQEAHTQINEASRRLLEVQESERKRIASELHDEVGQALTILKINLQTVGKVLNTQPALNIAQQSVNIVDRLLNQVRDLSLNLHPAILDDLGLIKAIDWLVYQHEQISKVKIQFFNDLAEHEIPKQIKIACFRILQEALTNIIRHSGADYVQIEFQKTDSVIQLNINDNGVGFNKSEVSEKGAKGLSLGIINMKERARLIGGILDIVTRPSGGTSILFTFPIT